MSRKPDIMKSKTKSGGTVLFDVRLLPPVVTGIGRYLSHMLYWFDKLRPDDIALHALCSSDQSIATNTPRRTLSGIGASAKPLGLLQQFVIPPVIHRSGCDLYHYTYYDPPWSAGRPLVATCYDIEPLRHPELFSHRIVWYYRLFTLRLKYADRVIVISEQTKRDLIELRGIRPERIQVAYLAAEEGFKVIDNLRKLHEMRVRYSLPDRYVLYVGNCRPHKNVSRVVEALAIIRQYEPDISLVIVGGYDSGRPAVEQTIRSLGLEPAVQFLGRVPESDLPLLYNGADVFVFPSLYEGFGLPVLEAMACGTPVVTSDRASLPEITGSAAMIVDPLQSQSIAQAVLRLLHNGDVARHYVHAGLVQAQRFSWRQCAEQHLDVYREVLH
jgi:glycosyltransferase involved in cell wall biosynthesis